MGVHEVILVVRGPVLPAVRDERRTVRVPGGGSSRVLRRRAANFLGAVLRVGPRLLPNYSRLQDGGVEQHHRGPVGGKRSQNFFATIMGAPLLTMERRSRPRSRPEEARVVEKLFPPDCWAASQVVVLVCGKTRDAGVLELRGPDDTWSRTDRAVGTRNSVWRFPSPPNSF